MIDLTLFAIVPAGFALSLERLTYYWIWRNPARFEALCEAEPLARLGAPVVAIRRLFYGFKGIQAIVFGAWIAGHAGWFEGVYPPRLLDLLSDFPAAVILGALAILFGQVLNFSVFQRLGRTGVFYGARFGHDVPWVDGFPFSLVSHPQYVGTVASIWGLFLATRFPNPDWLVLPILETIFYTLGAHFEREPDEAADPSETIL